MSGGALTQLVSRGFQDEDLSIADKPATSPFAKVFRKHSPYATESIECVFDGTVDFGKRIASTIIRRGDLITGMHLQVTLKKSGNTYFPSEQIISQIELQLGKVPFETLPGDWLRCRQELFASSDSKAAYARLTDFVDSEPVGATKTFYLPIPFFFHERPDLAIPLIAAQYHDVTVYINLATSDLVSGIDPTYKPEIRLFVDYAFLGTWERRMIAKSQHQLVVEQLQYQVTPCYVTSSPVLYKLPIAFNHPCRWLAWHMGASTLPYVYTGGQAGEPNEALGPVNQATLLLNGTERFQTREGTYFNSYQPYQTLKGASQPCAGLYFYSFSRDPHDPTASDNGDSTLNFSRIDAPLFTFTTKAANVASTSLIAKSTMTVTDAQKLTNITFYTSNYNVLIVKGGMYNLAYAC